MISRVLRSAASAVLVMMISHDSPAWAGVVTHVAQEDSATQFRTTTVAKANDADGDNIYGTAGYIFYTVDVPPVASGPVFGSSDPLTFNNGQFRTLASIPGYLALQNSGQAWIAGGFRGYQFIDDPSAVPGTTVPDVQSGLAINNFVSIGTQASLVDLVIGPGFPTAGLRVGVMMYGSGEDAMARVRLTQTSGAGGGSASAIRVGTPYTYCQFVDITKASVGDRYTLYLTKSPGGNNPNVAYLGLTFDELKVVPEPSSLALLGTAVLTGICPLWRRARRHRIRRLVRRSEADGA